jgi:hypothetical protein
MIRMTTDKNGGSLTAVIRRIASEKNRRILGEQQHDQQDNAGLRLLGHRHSIGK